MVTDTGKVPFTLALKTKNSSSRLCWEEEDGADELLPSLLTDNSSPPLEQQASKTMFRSVSMPRLSSNLSGVTAMAYGQTVKTPLAPLKQKYSYRGKKELERKGTMAGVHNGLP